jgi:hypothetical protein
MNKYQLQRLYENELVQFSIKVLIVSFGIVLTVFLIDIFDLNNFLYISHDGSVTHYEG